MSETKNTDPARVAAERIARIYHGDDDETAVRAIEQIIRDAYDQAAKAPESQSSER